MNFEGRSQEPEEMAANQEQSDATFYRHTTEMLEILEEFDADLENEITEDVKEMQGSYSEVFQSENDNYEKPENIRSPVEELLEKLEAIEKEWEEIEKQHQEREAKTRQEERKKQKPDWNKLKKKRIDKVYIGIEVECKFLRNFNIDTWFAIKPLIEDKGVYIGIQVPCRFLRKAFKIGT